MNQPRYAAVASAGFAAFVNIYAIQALLPTLCGVFHASRASVGLTISATTLAVALFSPLAGLVGSWMDRRQKVLIAMIGLVVCGLGAASSPSLEAMIAWRFAQGMFLPLLSSAIMTWLGEDSDPAVVGHTMSIYVAWTSVGGVCGRLTAGILGHHLGWRTAMVVLALLTGMAAAVLLSQLPDRKASPDLQGLSLRHMLALLREKRWRYTLAAGFCILFGVVGVFSYVTYYLSAPPFSLGPDRLSLLFLVYLLATTVTPMAGRMFAKVGYARSFRYSSLLGFAGILLTLKPYLPLVLLGLGLCAASAFIGQSCLSGYVSHSAGERRSLALGLYLSAYYLGGCAAGFVPAWAYAAGGWTGCAALFGAVYLTSATALAARLRMPKGC